MSQYRHTRRGKIARLPYGIRSELNARLQSTGSSRGVVRWLNAMPEVQTILAEQFRGRPIGSENLRSWMEGGYQDWLAPLPPPPLKPRKLSPAKARAQAREDFRATIRATFCEARPERIFPEIEARHGYVVNGDWQRGRCAVLAAVCAEFARLAGPLPARHLANLLVEKYAGLPLGRGVEKLIRFKLNRASLRNALRTWQAAKSPHPEIFALSPRHVRNPQNR